VSQDQTLVTGCLNSCDVQSKHIASENGITGDIAATLSANSCMTATRSGPSVIEHTFSLQGDGATSQNCMGVNEDVSFTLNGVDRHAVAHETVVLENHPADSRVNSVVRRLTPKECERLQGFPDDWTNIGDWTDSKGKKRETVDSARYKALGNSIALPYWFRLLRRISAVYDRPATLGSLFDGIGGFPLCWERCNGEGTAIWASEIEEFPIAVTKVHFQEGEEK
jgi:hypothetical protein